MPLSVKEFSDRVRERKPEYAHLDDVDLIQMVAKKKPELLQSVDRQDLIKVSNESVSKQVSKDRQKQFGALSGYSRFMAGAGEGMLDVYNGIKQLVGGDVSGYKEDKAAYMDASKGSKTALAGEILGGIAATSPTFLIPGVSGLNAIKNVANPLAKVGIALGTGATAGAGIGATEFVDDNETRAKNTLYGALFGAGTAGAGMLVKKIGVKAFNALKGKFSDSGVQELMDLSKKYDIPLSRADVTGKGKMTEKALEGVPGVGMGGFRKEGAQKVQEAIKKEASQVNPSWDEAIQESLARKSQAGRAQAKINYDKVEQLSSGVSIEPKNAIEKAAKHEADIADNIMGNEANPFTKIRQNLSKSGRTFSQLRKDRSDLQKAAQKASDAGDRNLARQLNDVKTGIENDIDLLVNKRVEIGTIGGAPKIMNTQDQRLKEAFHTAQEHYKANVVPYNDRTIINAIKSDTPDEIFNKFIKKGKGDRAANFYNLLDDKGKDALKDGLIDNAIKGATTESGVSPAKLAGYLERMSDPIESTLKGKELEQVKGLAKIMRHAERYGQLNESPSNGMSLIPYLKAGMMAAVGYGGATNPVATAAAGIGAGVLTKLTSLMRTKGYRLALASDKIGSPAFEKALNEIIDQLPKASAATAQKLKD